MRRLGFFGHNKPYVYLVARLRARSHRGVPVTDLTDYETTRLSGCLHE